MTALGLAQLGSLLGSGVDRITFSVPGDVPVVPDAPGARQWLREELSKAPYEAARPTWFDRVSQGFLDWINSLNVSGDGSLQGWLPAVAIILVLAALVAGWLLFGAPRLARRRQAASDLFGTIDQRSSAEMRTAAGSAASRGDWSLACEEIFRALARGLAERTVLSVTPGTTAHDFAVRARLTFPSRGPALALAAHTFDRVRYLEQAATEPDYRALATLEAELRAASPVTLAPLAEAGRS
ncbi:MAG: DUF4129 domain-containing protein [Cryobacterium sp.]|uniref:DUF4129 domain-containing protein n=1 Tax=unclassified Cryobacterium TaxID=2649013 RepID=UPI0018C96FA8|nr:MULTISPECIES: DUF4129 domain-containing protein [unclassified Cryobacterium]MCY7404930.1 DUF4129 domain-containing protein [Cryobacterium sp.]MEC5153232.1 hypothetical protein [Cryobacterium sp. CAN_C3]